MRTVGDDLDYIDARGWATRYGHRARLARACGREARRGRATFARSVNPVIARHWACDEVGGPKRSGKTSVRVWAGHEEKAWAAPGATVELFEELQDAAAAPVEAAAVRAEVAAALAEAAAVPAEAVQAEVVGAVPVEVAVEVARPPLLRQRSAPSTHEEVAEAERRMASAHVPLRAWAARRPVAPRRRPPTRWEVAARMAEERGRRITLAVRWACLAAKRLDVQAGQMAVSAAPAAAAAALARVLRAVMARPRQSRAWGLCGLACKLRSRAARAAEPTPAPFVGRFGCRGQPSHRPLHDAVAAFGACAGQRLAERPPTLLARLLPRLQGRLPEPPRVQQVQRASAPEAVQSEGEATTAAEAEFGVPLSRGSKEHRAVVEYFTKTLSGSSAVHVVSLARLHNREVYRRYAKTAGSGETVMFHGCKTLANEEGIIRSGFDVSHCRSGGLGYGTWLAYGASYSSGGFVHADAAGVRHIFVCMVSYHYVVLDNTTMRVVGQDCAYPMWLLKYRTLAAAPTSPRPPPVATAARVRRRK